MLLMAPTLAPLGLQAADLDTIVRDVTDPAAVDQAVRGCEAALLQPNGQTLTRDSPPGRPPGPCCGSKAEAERVARRYREADAPMASRPARDHLSPSVGHSLQVSSSAAMAPDGACGRSQSDARVGCMVWSTTPSTSSTVL